jgi:hypothetical protein
MDPALPTLQEQLQAKMYLLYREIRKGKKTGVVAWLLSLLRWEEGGLDP